MRARLLALSAMPDEWMQAVTQWRALNESSVIQVKDRGGTRRAPSRTHEYLLYQTIVGALPAEGIEPDFAERIAAYAVKAAREGKLETSWMNPNIAYEDALQQFTKQILDPSRSVVFLESMTGFARRLAVLGALNGMSQLTLKAMMPGVPDFYQGTEFWELSLVDPDNRRLPDFAARAEALRKAEAGPSWERLAAAGNDGHVKLAWTRALLELRRSLPHVFTHGGYQPLEVRGRDRDHIIAFARASGVDTVVVVVGRHFGAPTEGGRQWPASNRWEAEVVLEGVGDVAWRSLMGHDRIPAASAIAVASLFGPLPAAVLVGGSARTHARERRGTRAPTEAFT
jgi:(1->4)-alpha-D-glucan 1-alpha-D-glucosylmutase